MKKILFLIYVYPYGYYNASAACTTRIMHEFASKEDCEIHCISYSQYKKGSQPYNTIPDVICHYIDLQEPRKRTRFQKHLQIALRMPLYPLFSPCRILSHYKACKRICRENQFDMVVAQCYPEESVIAGALLKRAGFIKHLTVIFWDNIYGKNAARIIPAKFALRRSKKLESFIAKYADSMISLYPLKPYHEQNGDVPHSVGKRHYLGIPSILSPQAPVQTKYLEAVQEGKINILYSGSIIKPQFIPQLISLFNKSSYADKLNLLFFSKGVGQKEFDKLRKEFRGTIQSPGYIPIDELLTVYRNVDFFMSFPGDVNSIRSKCYEYMCYGHPMLLLYDNPADVNVQTFSKYPLSLALNVKDEDNTLIKKLDSFIDSQMGQQVTFNRLLELFPLDTPQAYVEYILNQCGNNER